MTLVTTSLLYPPPPQTFGNATPINYGSILLDATGEKAGFIFTVPKDGTLSKVRFRTGTVTTGDTLKVSFQDITATTGFPDETADQYRTIVVADANDNTELVTGILSSDGTDTGTKRAVTKGQVIAVVLEFDSYVAGNLNINDYSGSSGVMVYPYTCQKVGAGPTWAKRTVNVPIMAVEYDDGTYAWSPGVIPYVTGATQEDFASTSTPDEKGNLITIPFDATAHGVWVHAFPFSAGATMSLVLYNTDGTTAMATIVVDADITNQAGFTSGPGFFLFTTAQTLVKNGAYRVVMKPSAHNMRTYSLNYASAAALAADAGGDQCYSTTRTDAGAWTNVSTIRYPIGLILSQVQDTSGGGGGVSAGRIFAGM